MRKQRLLSGVLAVIIGLLFFGNRTVQAEGSWPGGPEVQAESAIVMEANTGAVLYEKNPHQQLYPASITKIMTTLLALENCSLDEEVTFSYNSVHKIERDSTHISRDVGEIMTMEQCLYAVMLGSANDCAYAVAEHAGKGYENFVAMMNEKAEELGCTDTHFNNPHGLTDPEHYTSAYDMALISRAALENETFRLITATTRYTIPVTNKHPNEETYIVNHHKMVTNYQGETAYLYKYCIGGKTGYTDLARNTLVTFAEKDGMTLICVVMKENGIAQYTDTRKLFDHCFDNFTMWNVTENEPEYMINGAADVELFGMAESFVDLDKNSQIVLPKGAVFSDASYQVVEKEDEESVVAALEYTYAGRKVGSAAIRKTNAVVKSYPFRSTEESAKGKHFVEIKAKYILMGVAAVILLGAVGLLIYYLGNNFYIIRHRFSAKRRQKNRFKTIKSGKHSKWKTRW